MNFKQGIVIIAGIAGIVLVVLCPRWIYLNSKSKSEKIEIGYRYIAQRPGIPAISNMENGREIKYYEIGAKPTDRLSRFNLSHSLYWNSNDLWIFVIKSELYNEGKSRKSSQRSRTTWRTEAA